MRALPASWRMSARTPSPEYDIWTQFVSNTLVSALKLDALENSHPIEVEVGHPSEVDDIFDNISYHKVTLCYLSSTKKEARFYPYSQGASVIRMLHNYMGKDAFCRGMNMYLKEHSYKNTLTEDLWRSLSDASQKPVAEVMSTWTSQMGFPVITVEKTKMEDGKIIMVKPQNKILNANRQISICYTFQSLRQAKFTANGTKPNGEEFHWQIPINTVTSEGKTDSFLMKDKTMDITIECGSWTKLNHNFISYYRVQYEPAYLDAFLPDILSHKISELNQLSLLDDLMAAVQSGRTSADVALKFISTGFRHNESYVVWSCGNNCFSKLRSIMADDEEAFEMLRVFMLDVMSHIVESVGWKAK
jgi:puromycin-sensitive aminopeptidase